MSEKTELAFRASCVLFHNKKFGPALITGTYDYGQDGNYLFDFRATLEKGKPLLWRKSVSQYVIETEGEIDPNVVVATIKQATQNILEKIEGDSTKPPTQKEDLEWAEAEEMSKEDKKGFVVTKKESPAEKYRPSYSLEEALKKHEIFERKRKENWWDRMKNIKY